MPQKPSLVLHIGTEKTGTTSIQRFLKLNSSELLRCGVYVPTFLGELNHRLAVYIAENEDRLDYFSRGLGVAKDIHKRRQIIKRTIEDIAVYSREFSHCNWIISSEHFQSRLLTTDEVRRLKRILSDHFGHVLIIVYLRDPIQTAIASWSTSVLSGESIFQLGRPGKAFHNNCDHMTLLRRWLSVFDRSQIVVRLFTPSEFTQGCLLRDFCMSTRIQWDPSFRIPPRENETLTYQSIKVLAHINQCIPVHHENVPNALRGNLNKYFSPPFFGNRSRYLPSEQEVNEWDLYYQESAEYLRNEFFPELQGRLWPLPKTRGDDDDIQFSTELSQSEREMIDLVTAIWSEKMGLISSLRDNLADLQLQEKSRASIEQSRFMK